MSDYVNEAEDKGIENFPYDWMKRTVEDPAKRQNTSSLSRFMFGGNEVYEKNKAVVLEAELNPSGWRLYRREDVQIRYRSRLQPIAASPNVRRVLTPPIAAIAEHHPCSPVQTCRCDRSYHDDF